MVKARVKKFQNIIDLISSLGCFILKRLFKGNFIYFWSFILIIMISYFLGTLYPNYVQRLYISLGESIRICIGKILSMILIYP